MAAVDLVDRRQQPVELSIGLKARPRDRGLRSIWSCRVRDGVDRVSLESRCAELNPDALDTDSQFSPNVLVVSLHRDERPLIKILIPPDCERHADAVDRALEQLEISAWPEQVGQ